MTTAGETRPPRSLWAATGYGPLPALLLVLTAVTGVVDAVSILALGRVFVANMTGNVVFAGFAAVGAPGFSLSASLFALAGFLVGAAIGGTLTVRSGKDRGALLRAGVLAEVILVAAALTVAATSGTPLRAAVADGIAALLATAMGIQNAVARKLAVPDLTTTVLTMTLTGIGADLRASFRGGPAQARDTLGRRLLAIATMLAGGVAGAWLVLNVSAVWALALATSLLAVTAAGALAAAARPGAWRSAPPGAPTRQHPDPPARRRPGSVPEDLWCYNRHAGLGLREDFVLAVNYAAYLTA
jgi:uncharacterized membrane protein YoaK (UPF0700 family)